MTAWTDATAIRPGELIVGRSGVGSTMKAVTKIEVNSAGSVRIATASRNGGDFTNHHPRNDEPVRFEVYQPERLVTIRNLAELKRALHGRTVNTDETEGPGTKLVVRNWNYPLLSGVREVLIAQSNSWCISFPECHPQHRDGEGSWLDIPKASQCTFLDNACTILRDPSWGDLTPFCTIQVLAS